MSKFNKCALVGAIALVVSGTALAAGTTTKPAAAEEYVFAFEVTNGTALNPTADTAAVAFSVAAPDILIGRSNTTGQITVSATIVGAVLDATLASTDFTIPGTAAFNSVSSTIGTSSFQFVMTPPTGAGFAAGAIFSIDNLELRSATGLQTNGGSVTVAFEVRDTTTGTLLSSSTATAVLTSATASSTANAAGTDNTIDVLTNGKKLFAGAIDFVTLGTVTVAQADVNSGTGSLQVASALGTTAAGNVSGGGDFVYNTAVDTIKLTLNVPQSGAFSGAGNGFYASDIACATAFTPSPTKVAFVASGSDFIATVPVTAPTGVTYNICAIADGTSVIEAQTIGLTSRIDLADILTRDPAAVTTTAFNVLKYNGAVKKVWHFNPASNTSVVSYLRVTNTSSISGLVSVDGTCDTGLATPSTAKFTLGERQSRLLTAQELAAGTGLIQGMGTCPGGGKSRLVITGEFGSMEVQNFMRNNTSIGVINTNVNNAD